MRPWAAAATCLTGLLMLIAGIVQALTGDAAPGLLLAGAGAIQLAAGLFTIDVDGR